MEKDYNILILIKCVDSVLYQVVAKLSNLEYEDYPSYAPSTSEAGDMPRYGFNGMERDNELKGKS